MTRPDVTVQSLVDGDWWVKDDGKSLVRGRLLNGFVVHVDQQPLELVTSGRVQATNHQSAVFEVQQLRLSESRKASILPVAALPVVPKERRIVQNAKVRPLLLLAEPAPEPDKNFRQGGAKWQTAPTLTVAPFYGTAKDGTRAGWNETLVERIWQCEYPQYLCDVLPLGKGDETSVLRLDATMPIGRHHESIKSTEYRLSANALEVLDEWMIWFQTGKLPEGGVIELVRAEYAGKH